MYRTLLPSTLVEKKNKMISMLFHLTTGRLVFITYDHNYTMWRDRDLSGKNQSCVPIKEEGYRQLEHLGSLYQPRDSN